MALFCYQEIQFLFLGFLFINVLLKFDTTTVELLKLILFCYKAE